MSNRRIAFLMNPSAGIRKKRRLREFVESSAKARNIPFEFSSTNAAGKYPELEEEIRNGKYSDVVIIGGDGTVRNVVAALRHTGVRFGLVPTGSGNGLALSAKIPVDTKKALDIVYEGTARPIDAFTINGHFSCMLSGIGFDAKVAHEFSRSPTRGLQTYLKIGIKNFFNARCYPFRIHMGGHVNHTEAYFISIANSNQFGNQFTIAPQAKLNDGLMDVVVVQKMNKLQLLISVIQQIRFGDIREDIFKKNCILYFQTDRFRIENPYNAPFHIDGDPAETSSSFDIGVIPNAFLLIQPSAE
ncbi:diacylglycerol/lipid kinase family protein [Pollutibacter soli]|uniref:diacylglycerol/lipid kinase family protein n=1 Tax=Pollutibacter soli TaxID=3034157 RepID=UPI003013A01F